MANKSLFFTSVIGAVVISCGVTYGLSATSKPTHKAPAKDKAEISRLIDANAKSLSLIKSGSGTTKTAYWGIVSLPDKQREYEMESTDKGVFSGCCSRSKVITRYIKDGMDESGPVPEGSIRTIESAYSEEESRMLYVESKSGWIRPGDRRHLTVFGVYQDPATNAACKKGESRILGYETIDGDKCTIVEFLGKWNENGQVTHLTEHCWFNPLKGGAIVKERFWQSIDGAPKQLIRERNAKMYECVPGIWLPARLEVKVYDKDPKTGKPRLMGKTVTIPDPGYQVNIPIDKSQFKLDFPSGTKVNDLAHCKEYTVP